MIRVELHAHTDDDPEDRIPYSAEELIAAAAARGYGGLAITLHDAPFDPSPLYAFARAHGVRLLPGIERTIEGAHVLGNDLDLLRWLAGARCTTVSSLGGLHHFRSDAVSRDYRDEVLFHGGSI